MPEPATIVLPDVRASSVLERGLCGVHDLNTACLDPGEGGRAGSIYWGTHAKIFVAMIKLANRSLGPHNLKVSFPACKI